MVRAAAKQSPDSDKTDSQRKRSSPKKKFAEPGSWPCKINGCNKVFAREADLKRHQRTTKTHTMPGFACPQCDATFTRTDALRRHQRSRHNGVIIEPQEADRSDQDPNGEGSGSRSSSRSATPTGSNADPESTDNSPQASTAQATQYTSKHPSYYRPHTMHTSAYPSRPVSMDNYPTPISIPTSAARLAGPPWQPPTGWPEGAPLPHPGMYPPPYYPPSSYYRPPLYPMPPPGFPHMHPEYMGQPYPYPGPPGPSFVPPPQGIMQPALSAIPRGSSAGPMKDGERNANGETSPDARGPPSKRRKVSYASNDAGGEVHDSRNHSIRDGQKTYNGPRAALEPSLKLDADEAATVVALLQQASGHSLTPHIRTPIKPEVVAVEATAKTVEPDNTSVPVSVISLDDTDADADADADGELDTDADAVADGEAYVEGNIEVQDTSDCEPQTVSVENQPRHQTPSSDDVLIENGVAMLNPAELLTFESLASPPQS